jgi:hypothetical protein
LPSQTALSLPAAPFECLIGVRQALANQMQIKPTDLSLDKLDKLVILYLIILFTSILIKGNQFNESLQTQDGAK